MNPLKVGHVRVGNGADTASQQTVKLFIIIIVKEYVPGVSFIELVTRRVTRSVKGFIERVNGSRKGYLKRDLRVLGVTRSMKLTPDFCLVCF